jgi:hypothetical protein
MILAPSNRPFADRKFAGRLRWDPSASRVINRAGAYAGRVLELKERQSIDRL